MVKSKVSTWQNTPSFLSDVEIKQNIFTKQRIWRLVYNIGKQTIITKWRTDSVPASLDQLKKSMLEKPKYFEG